MNLVIVESPTKGRTISQFLGKDFKVASSFGHIRDLPKSSLGIDVEKNFEPKYVIPVKAKKTVSELKKEVKKSDTVILATDSDREGEAIAWHLTEALGLGNPKSEIRNPKQKVERIVFHEITKRAIEEALKKPRKINLNLVDAQQGRRILDRLVGYKLSPFLWNKVAAGLSAGRVQSVTLRLIVDRENEIRNFKAQEYWTIVATLLKISAKGGSASGGKDQKSPPKADQPLAENIKDFEANLFKIGTKTLDKFAIKNKEEAQKIVAGLKQCDYSVLKIETKEVKKTPLAPFTTSTLQQEAVKRLRFSSKKTMFLAQRLYESGQITYMRTDSVNLSEESTAAAKKWLNENLGAPYAAEAPRLFKAKSKLVQEAHEAVRPTNPENTPEKIGLSDAGEKKLYELIWRRFIASQMPQAKISTTSVEILAGNQKSEVRGQKDYGLRATGQQILFDGYLKIWPQKLEERELPTLHESEELELKELKPEQHFTEPPPRYSEASLIKTLEEYGIGRPSTYAPTISVIQTRNYVVKEVGRFHPTDIGELVNKVLTENFPEIVDVTFTAQMEDELDDIARGKISWQGVISEFYQPFAKKLAEKYQAVQKQKIEPEKTDQKCELCGKPMVIRTGRFGKFLACSGFPECKNTKNLNRSEKSELNPNDTNRNRAIGMKCPKCLASPDPAERDSPGEIVERRVSRGRARGKIFWGCSRYPKCDYATWKNPTQKAD